MGPRRYRRGWSASGLTCRRRPGFNGAATLSSRMEQLGPQGQERLLELQWGRDVIVADGRAFLRLGSDSRKSFNGAATLSSRMVLPKSSGSVSV